MLTLYYARKTRSIRPLWILEELGVNYEPAVLDLAAGEHKHEDYLKIHPFGKVPALATDDGVLYESLAICLYLADRYPEQQLAPAPDTSDRAEYLQWMAFSIGTLEPAFLAYSAAQETTPVMTDLNLIGAVLDDHLATRPFILGDAFSAADILNGSLASWVFDARAWSDRPNIRAWVKRLQARPGWIAASAR